MAFDSTAELLFKVGADSSDAENNIRRFRALLSKDLSGIAAEFKDWSNSVFGNLNTVKGGLTAVAATTAAGMAAAGGALVAAAQRAAQYAAEIEDGMDKTGLAAEEMSKLRFAAQQTGVEYGKLVQSLVLFESSIEAARRGSQEQSEAFRRIGVTQKDLEEGSKRLLPLLMRTADAFAANASTVEKAAVARQLFGRGGADLLEFLSAGSRGLSEFKRRAEELGLVLTDKDVVAAKAFKLQMQEMKSQMDAVSLSVGTRVVPALTFLAVAFTAAIEVTKRNLTSWSGAARAFLEFPAQLVKEWEGMQARLKAALGEPGRSSLLPPPPKQETRETAQGFEQLSNMLEQVRVRVAQFGTEEERIAAETRHLQAEIGKAREKLFELSREGKITGETFRREMTALATLPVVLQDLVAAQVQEINDRRRAAIAAATADLAGRLARFEEESFDARRRAFLREIDLLRQKLATEGTLTRTNWKLLAELEQAGLHQIARERSAAYARLLQDLQSHLERIVAARFTTAERLAFAYQQDVERFSEAEEGKALALAQTEGEADAIREQFALNRAAALRRYETELNVLRNSRGWRAVFGEEFAAAIRENEELLRRWAETTEQAALLAAVALETMANQGRRAFADLSRGMAANVSHAVVYRQSIGEAMRAAAAATLQSIAAESLVYAIYATALGFLRLAQRDFQAAGQAFTAAAVFGTVGAAAAVAGRAIGPRQESAAGREGRGEGSSSGAGGESATAAQEARGPRVQIIVNGHIVGQSGVEELTEMINEAVKDRDVRLVATQVREEGRLIR